MFDCDMLEVYCLVCCKNCLVKLFVSGEISCVVIVYVDVVSVVVIKVVEVVGGWVVLFEV